MFDSHINHSIYIQIAAIRYGSKKGWNIYLYISDHCQFQISKSINEVNNEREYLLISESQ